MGTTLEQAINAEAATSAAQKTTQLNFLGTSTRALEKADLEAIIAMDYDGMTGITADNIHEVRELIKWRIENDFTVLPFTGLDLGSNAVYF